MKWVLRIFFSLLTLVFVIALPFVVLIKGSVYMYEAHHFPTVLALLVSGAATFLLLFIYITFLYGAVFAKLSKASLKGKAMVVMLLLFVYCGYMMVNLSAANAKTASVKSEFSSLHPLLRLSAGTFIIMDEGMLITDMSRGKEDYKKMGLKTLKNSLHYKQGDGYVHALDLRTIGRSEMRNRLLKGYFNLMGFNTLRHSGTADHLHVSLSTHDNPKAI